jgi:hypothetical protein
MADLSRRDFFTRGVPGRVAALLGAGIAAAPGAAAGGTAKPGVGDVSARDLRKMSRAEVREALRRIRAQRRTR